MAPRQIIKDIYRLYQRAGVLTQAYIKIKLKISPILKLEAYLPREGKILDLGCGIGLFSNIISLTSAARFVEGIDIDSGKIRCANATVSNRGNILFSIKQIQDISGSDYDAIVISDTLYLIPYAQQERILKNCFGKLKNEGLLLIKEIDRQPLWKFMINLFQELLAVRVFRFTRGDKFFFRSSAEYRELLSAIGFKIEVVPLDRGFAYPHVAYICSK